MTAYIQILMNICFTMVTGVVIVGCLCTTMFLALLFWQFLEEHRG